MSTLGGLRGGHLCLYVEPRWSRRAGCFWHGHSYLVKQHLKQHAGLPSPQFFRKGKDILGLPPPCTKQLCWRLPGGRRSFPGTLYFRSPIFLIRRPEES